MEMGGKMWMILRKGEGWEKEDRNTLAGVKKRGRRKTRKEMLVRKMEL